MHGRLRARSGAVGARRRPGRLQRQAAGARHGRASSRSWKARSGASRRSPTPASAGSSTAPRRSRPTTSSSWASPRSRGFFVAAGFSAHGIAGAGGIGRQMASWIVDGRARARPLEDGHPAVRAGVPVAGVHARALDRELRDLLRHPLPERGAPGRPAVADVADVRDARRPRRRLRREVRLGAPELVRAERRRPGSATEALERLRPRGWAGQHWSPAIARRGARDAAGGGAVRRDVVRQARGRRAGRVSRSSSSVAGNDIDRPVGSIVYTQLLDRRGGIQADLTVTRLAAERFLLVTGHGVRQPRPRLAAVDAPAGRRIGDGPRRHVVAGLLRPVGAAGARHPGAASRRDDVSERRLPVPHRARDHRRLGAGAGAAGHLRRGARLGAVRPDRVRPRALDDALGRPVASTAWSPAGTGRSTRSGSRRAIASWSSDITPDETPFEAGPRVRGRARQGRRLHRARRARRRARPPARASGCAASCSTTRWPSASATSRSGSTARSSAGSPVGRLRLRGRAVDRLRLPAARPRRDRHARRGRGVRRVGRLRGRARAAVRPGQRRGSGHERARPPEFGSDWSAAPAARHRRRAARLARRRPGGLRRGRRHRPGALPARPRDRRPSPTARS